MIEFRITKSSFPVNEPITQEEYDKGLRDPWWVAEYKIIDYSNTNTPYIPKELCKKLEFYTWCAERGIRVEIVTGARETFLYGYIQDEHQALEAKIKWG